MVKRPHYSLIKKRETPKDEGELLIEAMTDYK